MIVAVTHVSAAAIATGMVSGRSTGLACVMQIAIIQMAGTWIVGFAALETSDQSRGVEIEALSICSAMLHAVAVSTVAETADAVVGGIAHMPSADQTLRMINRAIAELYSHSLCSDPSHRGLPQCAQFAWSAAL